MFLLLQCLSAVQFYLLTMDINLMHDTVIDSTECIKKISKSIFTSS